MLTKILIVLAILLISIDLLSSRFSNQVLSYPLLRNQLLQLSLNNTISEISLQIKALSLSVREERRLPSGSTPDPNRDIGFASVFISLENPLERIEKIIIYKIEVKGNLTGKVYIVDSSLQTIQLNPLEKSDLVFQLTNKTGFSTQEPIKAVLYYQLNNKNNILESSPVEVNRL